MEINGYGYRNFKVAVEEDVTVEGDDPVEKVMDALTALRKDGGRM